MVRLYTHFHTPAHIASIMIKIELVMELNEDDGMMDDVIEDGDVIMLLS